jgi:hypothetical protein
MALVNPNIAMSFRQPEFTPRNALAEYAQIQQIQGGQRQAEIADMQLRRMRQEDEDIDRIHQIAMKNGGPDSRMEMGRALFASRNKDQRELGYKIIQHEEAVRAYNSEFGPGAMAAPTMPKSAPGTMAMPSTPAPRTERGVDAYGKPFDAEVGGGIAPPGAMGQPLAPLDAPASANEPYPGYNASIGMPTPSANALAPTPTPSANALAPAAPNIDALRRQYGMAVAAGRPDAPVLLKQIEAALRGDQVRAPKITVLGVAKGTETPVYFDEVASQQFTIGSGPSGQQIRVPYMGGVNRSTSNVTATATSAGTPVTKSLAGPVGARAETSLAKAEGASGIMESANMVRDALNTGNVIAGPLAGVRTKFAQVLELAGAGDKEKLVNTRTAIQGLATLTLESRAELKGQGQVTENEQKLLERARSGNIEDMTIAELQSIVNVSQRLAGRLWSSHQNLLKTMETDPAAADSLRYYKPTTSLPQAVGEGRPKAEVDKRQQGLANIFGGKK